jgi:hypothetical protein
MNEAAGFEETIFLVNREPWLVTDPDLRERNLAFINGIDADYFLYCLNVHKQTENDDSSHASIAMQANLYHALETLFSLIGVLLQAHDCGYAWLAKCSTVDLIKVLERVTAKDQSLFTKLVSLEISWESIALKIAQLCEPESTSRLPNDFAISHGRCLSRLAAEMTDRDKRDVYNSIKHGFRIRPGGFKLWVSPADVNNPTPPTSNDGMHLVAESDYGASFIKLVPLSSARKEQGLKLEEVSVNWDPTRTSLLTQLAYSYIANVQCALKKLNRVAGEHRYFTFPDLGELEKPWHIGEHSVMKTSIQHDSVNGPHYTKQKLLDYIRKIEVKYNRTKNPSD